MLEEDSDMPYAGRVVVVAKLHLGAPSSLHTKSPVLTGVMLSSPADYLGIAKAAVTSLVFVVLVMSLVSSFPDYRVAFGVTTEMIMPRWEGRHSRGYKTH